MAISAAPLADPADDAWLCALAAAGVESLQIREKGRGDREIVELLRRARPGGFETGRLLVNGRIDLAIAGGADGVHLPGDEIPTAALRARFGPGLLIGRSTHRLSEIEAAAREGADYVSFGPVWPTPSKPGRSGVGIRALREAAGIGIPVLALGGLDLARIEEASDAGAWGVAAIRLFADPERLPEAAARVHAAFGEGGSR